MEGFNSVETDDNYGQPQERQDNMSFILNNYNVQCMVKSTDIFNYFSSLFGTSQTVIEDTMFLAPDIKAFIGTNQEKNKPESATRISIIFYPVAFMTWN
uniref:Uncharacterized protein n=1 Tax=Romanomermis culicivorax TaxID=13658 RepID=A0A915HPX2_ROMCU